MRYHIQQHTVVRNENGDIIRAGSCYPTVIACLLDIELSEVPYFQLLYWSCSGQKENIAKRFKNRYLEGKEVSEFPEGSIEVENFNRAVGRSYHLWTDVKDYWLASMGYVEEYIEDEDIAQWLNDNPGVPYMVSGKSSRGVDHVVIYQDGKLLHDPHPSGEGVTEIWSKGAYQVLVKIEDTLGRGASNL